MSIKRKLPLPYWDPRYDLVPFAFDLPHRHQIPLHLHHRDQLVYARTGVMTITTNRGAWVIPPNRAVWVPNGVEHRLRMSGRVEMRTLYFRHDVVSSLPRSCCVVAVSPLLRELILYVVAHGPLKRRTARGRRILDFLLDQMRQLAVLPLHVPWPTDPRARRVAESVAENPASAVTLDQHAKRIHAGKRTIERLFLAETNLSFRHWRQQVRLLQSLERLAAGKTVTTAALDVGYDSTSAFIAAFRQTFGATPRKYFRDDPQ